MSRRPFLTERRGRIGRLLSIALLASLLGGMTIPATAGLTRAAPVHPGAVVVTISRYTAIIRATRDLLRGVDTTESISTTPAVRATTLLNGFAAVVMPGGSRVVPDNSAVLADLAARPPRYASALARLNALLDALAHDRTSTKVRADNAAMLNAIFGRPPFTGAATSPWAGFWQAILTWLGDLLAGLPPNGVGVSIWRLIQAAVILAAAAVVATIVLVAGRGLFQTLSPSPATPADPLALDAGLTALDARGRASDFASRAEYRLAVRYQFLAVLLEMDGRGVLRFDTSAADRDLVGQALRRDPILGNLLAQAARTFQTVWFGHQTCTAGDYSALVSLAERLSQVAEEVPRPHESSGGDERRAQI